MSAACVMFHERMFPTERAWAAGFLDAEGHFAARPTHQVTVSQVDLEPLDVFAKTVGVGTIKGPYDKATPTFFRQPQYLYYGYGARAKLVFAYVEPWLGRYRRNQALAAGFPSSAEPKNFAQLPLGERIAWCGGFFDGEGCFNYTRNPGLQTRITHTDLELLERFATTIGIGHVYGPYAPHGTSGGKRPHYVFSISGFEGMQAILAMLWPWLSSRRRLTAISILQDYLGFYRCGHARSGRWRKYCPECFQPGPRPRSDRRREGA